MTQLRKAVITPCGHSFCNHCIVQALSHKTTCPNCRNTIQGSLIPNYLIQDLCSNSLTAEAKLNESIEEKTITTNICAICNIALHMKCITCEAYNLFQFCPVYVMKCNDLFHTHCIGRWYRGRPNQCPVHH